MEDIRWVQRFENFSKALLRLQQALDAIKKEPENHLYEMATIQAFEFSIELGWKFLKDYLKYQGVKDVSLPRDVIRQAFQAQVISEGQIWMDMLDARNKTSHTYDDKQAAMIVKKIQDAFFPVLMQAYHDFNKK